MYIIVFARYFLLLNLKGGGGHQFQRRKKGYNYRIFADFNNVNCHYPQFISMCISDIYCNKKNRKFSFYYGNF